ncbi:hypothetical protein SADUNF_Sadunf08G0012800 [Salix dunnii]|uniref:AMMECR1 domain-containing protein n=1 Tax=Salix dunnii TaxID=1413687 RepID=A0A835JWX7_9ROSI|nr:hypothetical protein SADUNF_Sadunf08G0012800 [Salix dunnii]
MYVLQLGAEGLTGRLLFGSYTVFEPEVASIMVFIVLASTPVSAALRKMRNKRSMAFSITKGVFLQNPMAIKISRRGDREQILAPYLLSCSTLRNRRFPPIQAKEWPTLECTVSILTDYETANHYLDWEVGKHGLIIEFTDPNNNARRSATYLPEVAALEGGTREEAIDSLMRRAGYSGHITESL